MGNQTMRLLLIVSILFVAGCEKIDIRGTFVSYESVNERFEQSMQWNQQNPYKELTAPAEDYELFVMGDSHVGGIKNLNSFLKGAVDANALAIVMAGDLTTGKADDYIVFSENFANSGGIDIFLMAGNHDLYFDGWKEFRSRFGSSTYYFTVRTPDTTDLFICLDSGSGTLGSKQLSWLKELLKDERPKHRHCVVITHVNFFRARHTSSTNPQVEELQVLMDLFLTHRVDMVITGHDHKKSSEKIGVTRYVIMNALLDDFKDAGYLVLSVEKKNGPVHRYVNF